MAFNNQTLQSARDATNLLELFRAVYTQSKIIQAALAKYQANTDPVFNAAINALFTNAERNELGAMAQQVNTLITDWETNHSTVLSG